MSELKKLHPYLYRRVRLKGILFSLLGLSSIFAQQLDNFFQSTRPGNATGISTVITGGVFLAIGLFILVTLWGSPRGYLKSRWGLYAAFIYALFWEFILVILAFTQHISTVSIFILWGYLTYNLFLILRDSAWGGAEIVREVRENGE